MLFFTNRFCKPPSLFLVQDSAARFVQQLPPAAPVGSGLRPSGGIGRFSGGGTGSARPGAGSEWGNGAGRLQAASTPASGATATAPITPAAALAASVAAAAAVAQHLAARDRDSGNLRQSPHAAHDGAAEAAGDAADMAACRREVLQHSPQRTPQPAGSPLQGGTEAKSGDRRTSIRIKRRHADAASASLSDTLPAAVGSRTEGIRARNCDAARPTDASIRSPSLQKTATPGARSSVPQACALTTTPDAATARQGKDQQGQHSLHDLPAGHGHSSQQQERHSPSREHWHSGSPGQKPAGWTHISGAPVGAQLVSGSLLPQQRRHTPLQPLQAPTMAAWQMWHDPTESKHGGSRSRSRVSVDATATTTARVLQVLPARATMIRQCHSAEF